MITPMAAGISGVTCTVTWNPNPPTDDNPFHGDRAAQLQLGSRSDVQIEYDIHRVVDDAGRLLTNTDVPLCLERAVTCCRSDLNHAGDDRTNVLRAGRQGSVTTQVALSLPVLIGVTALGLDAGMLYVQRRQAQTAAEAASLAGAYVIKNGGTLAPPRRRPSRPARKTASRSRRLRSPSLRPDTSRHRPPRHNRGSSAPFGGRERCRPRPARLRGPRTARPGAAGPAGRPRLTRHTR